MIVTLEIDAASRERIAAHERAAGAAGEAIGEALLTAAVAGAADVRAQLVRGQLGLTMQRPGSGLAASLMGWMVDDSVPLAALGVPANTPAARYAAIHERGGTITPRTAKALAVPVSAEAKRHTSPRDMADLDFIPRKGRPPLLVRQLKRRGDVVGMEVHWVLVASVTIRAVHWLTRGVEHAREGMTDAFADRLGEYLDEWEGA